MNSKAIRKQLLAAVAMVLVAAVALGSSTYAWFAQATQVTASGMSVKAQSEGGLIISNESKTDWKTSSTASHNDVAPLVPTSTADCTAWYHNKSEDYNDAAAKQATGTYETLVTTLGKTDGTPNTGGIGFVDADGNFSKGTNENGYYLLNKFYIKSSADAMTGTTLYINKIEVTGATTSAELDKALRVSIVINGKTYIYAPFDGATLEYYVKGAADKTTAINAKDKFVNTATDVTNIPANSTDSPIEAAVYLYFEGEDANCKSANITSSLDQLQLTLVFGTTTITA